MFFLQKAKISEFSFSSTDLTFSSFSGRSYVNISKMQFENVTLAFLAKFTFPDILQNVKNVAIKTLI